MVTLDQIVPEEVVVYMEAGPGAMGDQNLDFDEVCRRLPDGLEYYDGGRFYSDRTKWKIFGGGMGNQFLIRSQYYPELKKMCENAPRGYYRRSIPYVEKLLLELASSPGGYDRNLAENLGLRCLAAPGLPGRSAPQSAAELLRREFRRAMKEERE